MGVVTNPCYFYLTTIDNKQICKTTLLIGKRLWTPVPRASYYDCPAGPAYIEVAGKRIHIQLLLDSGSNIFLINKDLVEHFDIPYETRHKALNILDFNSKINSSKEKHLTHPILLKLQNHSHRTRISCKVAAAGKYAFIIPFRWWHKEHPIANIDEPQKRTFTEQCCLGHIEDEGVGGMFEGMRQWLLTKKLSTWAGYVDKRTQTKYCWTRYHNTTRIITNYFSQQQQTN